MARMNREHVHFIGIGGVGMSAVAKILIDSGSTVTGSDEAVYEPVASYLTLSGISYKTPYAAENIPTDVNRIVVGKNAKLTKENNAEVREAYARGVPVISYPEMLAELAQNSEQIVIAGSYGKSTATALIAHCLTEANLDPSYFIGAVPFSPSESGHTGTGNLFVLEGDEYPSSNEDPRSKFLHFSPRHLLLTPLSHDHLNIFPTEEAYLAPFVELIAKVPADGSVTVALSGELSKKFLADTNRNATTYSVSEGDWHASNIVYGAPTTFSILNNGKHIVDISTQELGSHAVENIIGVAALLLGQSLITAEQFAGAISSFKGIRRRLDLKSTKTSVRIYEGFGSSIEKAKAAIAAMKLHFPDRRLLIAFEPHTFSWRNRGALPWYDSVFAGAAEVFVYEPPSHGAGTHDQINLEEIVARVQSAGIKAVGVENAEAGLSAIAQTLTADDVILILTSGDMGGMVEALPKLAEEHYPKQT